MKGRSLIYPKGKSKEFNLKPKLCQSYKKNDTTPCNYIVINSWYVWISKVVFLMHIINLPSLSWPN